VSDGDPWRALLAGLARKLDRETLIIDLIALWRRKIVVVGSKGPHSVFSDVLPFPICILGGIDFPVSLVFLLMLI